MFGVTTPKNNALLVEREGEESDNEMEFFNIPVNIHEHGDAFSIRGVVHASNITFPFYISLLPGLLVRFVGTDD